MALNSNALGAAVKNAILAINPDSGLLNGAESTLLETYWQAIATEYESHYEALMDVLPGTFQTFDVAHSAVEPVTGVGKVT